MEFVKNQIVTLTIEDMGTNGEGVGRVDGFTLFIKEVSVAILLPPSEESLIGCYTLFELVGQFEK